MRWSIARASLAIGPHTATTLPLATLRCAALLLTLEATIGIGLPMAPLLLVTAVPRSVALLPTPVPTIGTGEPMAITLSLLSTRCRFQLLEKLSEKCSRWPDSSVRSATAAHSIHINCRAHWSCTEMIVSMLGPGPGHINAGPAYCGTALQNKERLVVDRKTWPTTQRYLLHRMGHSCDPHTLTR